MNQHRFPSTVLQRLGRPPWEGPPTPAAVTCFGRHHRPRPGAALCACTATRSCTLRASAATAAPKGNLAHEEGKKHSNRGRFQWPHNHSGAVWGFGVLGVLWGFFLFLIEFQFQKITVICQRLSQVMSFSKGPSSGQMCL